MRFDELPDAIVDRVIATLGPYVSAERQARIESAIATRTRDVVLVLENVSDDHNASAVLRTSEAFGVLEVHIVESSAKFVIEAKTSSGAHKWLDIARYREAASAYQELKRRGYSIWASGIRGDAIPVQAIDVSKKIALVFGNEHEGLSVEATRAADGRFRVPMVGFVESLNVSVATAVSTYDVLTRRRHAGFDLSLPEHDRRRLRAAWYAISVRAARQLLEREGLPFPIMNKKPFAEVERRTR